MRPILIALCLILACLACAPTAEAGPLRRVARGVAAVGRARPLRAVLRVRPLRRAARAFAGGC